MGSSGLPKIVFPSTQQTSPATSTDESPVAPYDFGQQVQVDPYTGQPRLPNSDFSPPKPISPSDRFGVPFTAEEITPFNAAPGFVVNALHGARGWLEKQFTMC
jgi:hypothetical protein